MKKFLGLSLLIVVFFSCSEDDEVVLRTDLTRYVDSVFTEVTIEKNIQYGNNNTLIGINKNLLLDVYYPAGDSLDKRPTIILAHGGAFIGGKRGDLNDLCISYASKGYTVASISYNLIDDRFISDSVRFSEAVVIALGDMKGAIRFMRHSALNGNNDYGVDADQIFVGGISAGAILANHAGLLDKDDPRIPDYLQTHIDNNGGFEGDTNNLTVSSEVKAVLSFSGSLLRDHWIDANDPPIFMVHEEFDQVVPCDYSASVLFPFKILAHGSCSLQGQLESAGIENEFVFYAGADAHVGYFTDGDRIAQQELIRSSALFLSQFID